MKDGSEARPTVEVTPIAHRASSVPQSLLVWARRAVWEAQQPNAGPPEGIIALLLIANAGEAILNRLLEPLMEKDWEVFEQKNAHAKWQRLSTLIKLKPGLSGEKEPLKAYLQMIDTRNALVHFKHGKNIAVLEGLSVGATYLNGKFSVDLGPLNARDLRVVKDHEVEPEVAPQKAAAHLKALTDLLRRVVPHYPEDQFEIVAALKAGLDTEIDECFRFEGKRMQAALRRAHDLVAGFQFPEEESFAKSAARTLLLRLPRQIRGILVLLERRLFREADAVVRELAEAALSASWVGLDETRGRQFRDFGLQQTRALFDLLAKEGSPFVGNGDPFSEDSGTILPSVRERLTGASEELAHLLALTGHRTSSVDAIRDRLQSATDSEPIHLIPLLTLRDAAKATALLLEAANKVTAEPSLLDAATTLRSAIVAEMGDDAPPTIPRTQE